MTRLTTILSLLWLFCTTSFAQNLTEPCGTDEIHQKLLSSDKAYKKRFEAFESQVDAFLQQSKKFKTSSANEVVYKIPLVVHVLEPSTSSSIMSDAEINTMIASLNNQLNAGTGYTGSQDINVEFELAKRDPNCNATSGIVRVDMSGNSAYVNYGVKRSGSNGISDRDAKATSNWGNLNYYNLWVTNKIDGKTTNGVIGYAYFPGASADVDGAMMIANRLKDANSTLLIHELGHAFNLYHTFQGYGGNETDGYTCPTNGNPTSDGDKCADTDPIVYSGDTDPLFRPKVTPLIF